MSIDNQIRIYLGKRRGRDSFYVAGPANELLYPQFRPEATNKRLYLSKVTPEKDVFGEYTPTKHSAGDVVTLSPFTDDKLRLTSTQRTFYEQVDYKLLVREVKDISSKQYLSVFIDHPEPIQSYAHLIREQDVDIREQDVDDASLIKIHDLIQDYLLDYSRLRQNMHRLVDLLK